ncbi:MAG: c-type cytochrome [Deltaproteobacteria bacterium]|nr:c-type cytochrome [Deltaproteobacteria bacterium]
MLAAATALAEPRRDYLSYCAPCHGARGDGRGPAGRLLAPLPRDFTRGAFKFRSTPSGSLPKDEDILRVIDEGLRGTAMVGWRTRLPAPRRRALVEVVKGFSPRFARERAPAPIAIPRPSPIDARAASRGHAVYRRMQCAECHGDGARGDGPSVPTLVDDLADPIVPSDLTRRDDIRRRSQYGMMLVMLSGMDGTPMPSYADSISPSESWDLVRWLVGLQRSPGWLQRFLDPPLVWRGGP